MLEQRLGGTLKDGDATTCTGPAGTVIFADVASHYHWIYFPEPEYVFYRAGSYSALVPGR